MIISGQAVILYGEIRATKDIDITLGIDIDESEKIINLGRSLNLKILPENPKDFIKETYVLPLYDEKSGFRVDFIFSFSQYEKEAIKRVKKIKIDDVYINYASIEDLIIHKIIAGRERDMEDIKGILIKNRRVDENYILKWLGEFEKATEEKLTEKFFEIKRRVENA